MLYYPSLNVKVSLTCRPEFNAITWWNIACGASGSTVGTAVATVTGPGLLPQAGTVPALWAVNIFGTQTMCPGSSFLMQPRALSQSTDRKDPPTHCLAWTTHPLWHFSRIHLLSLSYSLCVHAVQCVDQTPKGNRKQRNSDGGSITFKLWPHRVFIKILLHKSKN